MATRSERELGALVIIGGHEDRKGEMRILRVVAERCAQGPLVIATLASSVAGELWNEYRHAFGKIGIDVVHLDIGQRWTASEEETAAALAGAGGVFFTGGDQLAITSKLGGTATAAAIANVRRRGGVIAGTSAGASAMSETMLVGGASDGSPDARDAVRMAPGLGYVPDMVIDQHFAERGRIGRLLAAVALNPRILGVGIDEDTALVVDGSSCHVVGSGAVYFVDGSELTYSNVSDARTEERLTLCDAKLHVLADGTEFDRAARRPTLGSSKPSRRTESEPRVSRRAPKRKARGRPSA